MMDMPSLKPWKKNVARIREGQASPILERFFFQNQGGWVGRELPSTFWGMHLPNLPKSVLAVTKYHQNGLI